MKSRSKKGRGRAGRGKEAPRASGAEASGRSNARSQGVAPPGSERSEPTASATLGRFGWARRPAFVPWWIALWSFLAQLAFLIAADLRGAHPTGQFFLGDTLNYLQSARLLSIGESLSGGLPFRPPLTAWLMVPLWWWTGEAVKILFGAKVLMALLNATTYALLYRLVRERMPHAFLACLLMPLSFGELLLSAAVGNEVVYRLLLVGILLVGWRVPWLSGLLNGLAALTRAEHLGLALGLAAVTAVFVPARRKAVAVAAAVGLAVLVPYLAVISGQIGEYNETHAARMPEPLPTVVPVSFYGPLNFALAQREEGIHFSRRSLPPAPGGAAGLDPAFEPHNEAIVHGYRLGFAAIAEDPGRFVARSLAKVGHSLHGVAFGWTWADWPKGGRWIRQPVDLAMAPSVPYAVAFWSLVLLGGWSLRRDRSLLAVAVGLVAFRLAINVVFFPYLRGMLVAGPLLILFGVAGIGFLARGWSRRVLVGLLVLLAGLHWIGVWRPASYQVQGERLPNGALIDDRPLTIERR